MKVSRKRNVKSLFTKIRIFIRVLKLNLNRITLEKLIPQKSTQSKPPLTPLNNASHLGSGALLQTP